MAKKIKEIEFPFYTYLSLFYKQERQKIVSSYKQLTKKFLSFNDPRNGTAYLRLPQFEALEMYVFLKEFCDNKHLHSIFEDWYYRNGKFVNRAETGITARGQYTLFNPIEAQQTEDKEFFLSVYQQIREVEQSYPNYIFALTMGLGKTILMATSIFYEFLLANKYPKDERYCHNVLVFAPDKTVLQSLRELQSFDKSKVVPPEYVNLLDTNIKFHFLDETGDALNAIDKSKYNIIVSNTQKIILKRQSKEKTPSQKLFEDAGKIYQAKTLNTDFSDLYGFDIDTDQDLITNQRFAKLTRLQQLGIYLDEAHHVFGSQLAKDFGLVKVATSLRLTINELAESLKEAGTKVVGCYNYTGTPYVKNRLLPEVVYSYGLRDAIENKYLKKVKVSGIANIQNQTLAFVRLAIEEFWKTHNGKRYEGILPKIAFFASSIDELQNELRPAVETVLSELDIPQTKILVNVGDPKLTNNDDLREFNNLDRPTSDKQFILLVNKGKEGWNCRSLFAVGLHRNPNSNVFVLQATMRCLRQIGEAQEQGHVYLSKDNEQILKSELEENLRLSLDDLNKAGDENERVEIRVVIKPPPKIKLKRIKKLHQIKEKSVSEGISLGLDEVDTSKYRITVDISLITDLKKVISSEDITEIKEKRLYSEITLVAEIARYLNLSPLRIREILDTTEEGIAKILESVNEYNELLFDFIIPRLFNALYELIEYENKQEIELELVKVPKDKDFYRITAKKGLRAYFEDEKYAKFKDKSFHLDNYCFDSNPENDLFWSLLNDDRVEKVWFTGMLTHGQSDFTINYIDPESHTVRCYYPDFLVQLKDESYLILEVKGDNMIEDSVVKAKAEYAQQLATSSDMQYKMIKGSQAKAGLI
jgi:type III restriction enzyme